MHQLITLNLDLVLKTGTLISEEMVVVDPEALEDFFIDGSLDIDASQVHFDQDAWVAVKSLVNTKSKVQ